MIPVTKPFLPPKEEVYALLDGVFERNWLTNNGPLVKQLEYSLEQYLSAKYLQYVSNGTIALQIAIKTLNLSGEIITTPFSYAATTSSILWQNCKPKYVDINPKNFCINSSKIEEAITDRTTAILATHVYGLPCNFDHIKAIAEKHNLKVVYDAAHAFGVKLNGTPITNHGDISILSFHATKVYHCIEGGALITNNKRLNDQIFLAKAFGHKGDDHVQLGINGKVSEFHAAMGICVLKYFDEIKNDRKERWLRYSENLINKVRVIIIPEELDYNYGYFPVLFDSEDQAKRVLLAFKQNDIEARRYFYPSLNQLPYLDDYVSCTISEDYSGRILCLPLYHDLRLYDVDKISEILINNL